MLRSSDYYYFSFQLKIEFCVALRPTRHIQNECTHALNNIALGVNSNRHGIRLLHFGQMVVSFMRLFLICALSAWLDCDEMVARKCLSPNLVSLSFWNDHPNGANVQKKNSTANFANHYFVFGGTYQSVTRSNEPTNEYLVDLLFNCANSYWDTGCANN